MTKQGLYRQIISFIEIGVYLLLFFGILALHEALVSAKDGIQFHFYGFAIVNALIFGKVILVAEDFSFADWFKEQRPIYAILAKSVAFTLLLVVFYIVEEVVVGKFKRQTISESFPHIGDGSPKAWLFAIIIITIGLIPFFAFREVGRVLGEHELRSLFLTPAKGYLQGGGRTTT